MGQTGAFRSLRYRNARLYFGGLMVSNVGTWMQATALSILVYRLTGRGTDLGVVVALQFLPMLLLGAWAGAVSDRVDKRRMALITQTVLCAHAALMAGLGFADLLTLPVVYAMALLLGIANAMDNPARRGLVIEVVDPIDIPNAVGLNTAVMTGSRIFGPALAAALVDPLGPDWLFALNALSFVAVLVSIVVLDTSKLYPAPHARRGGTPVRDSLRFVRRNHEIFVLFVSLTIISTFAFNYSVSYPKLADERFGDDRWFGWLLAVTSLGSVIGSLLTARKSHVTMRWFLGSTLLLGASGPFIAWAPHVAVAVVASIPLGIGGAGFIASVNAISQAECPPDMRGRLLALTAVAFLGSTPVGGPITGVIADAVGAEWSMAYGSIVAVTVVAWASLSLRSRTRVTEAAS